MLSKVGELRRDDFCFDYTGVNEKISIFKCHGQGGNQYWFMDDDGLIHHKKGLCIQLLDDKTSIVMAECNKNNIQQKWLWRKNEKTTN